MQFAQLIARWNDLPRGVRASGLVVLVALAGLAIVLAIVAHPVRVSLFATPLHAEQLAEVEEQLASWDVPFTLMTDNVVVDRAQRNDLLLRLSLAGVPHAHVQTSGEAFADIGVLTPQAVIDARERAGLAGDIQAGLRGIQGIDDARVIVAPAKTAEFADESSREASASVRVRMRSSASLSHEAIAGVRAFVAASVPGLTPERVTILDDRGVALSDTDVSDEAADAQRSLQSALDATFGEKVTVVRVHAEYRNDRSSERDLRRVPLQGAAIAHAAHNEALDDAGKHYRRRDETDDRGSETREIVSESREGRLQRVSTAVFVDADRALDTAKVRALAAATVGYDAARGDSLVVQAVDFHHAQVARRTRWWLLYGAIAPLLPILVIAAAVIAGGRAVLPPLVGLLKTVLERISADRRAKAVAGFAPAHVRNALAHEPPHSAAAIISALPAATAAAVLDLYPQHERDAIVKRMQCSHSPLLADAADLLRRHG